MNPRGTQVNFSKGEIGPDLYGRFDVDTWRAALKQAKNVLVLKYGGITKRPGHRFVAEVIDSTEETRLIPFEFSLSQTYALEFGQGYMSPHALGGRLLEEEIDITNISAAANAQITALFHGYSAGELVYLSGIDGEMGDLLNGRYWEVVSDVDTDNFTINADTTGLTFTSSDGGITRVGAPAPPPTPPTVPSPVDPPADPDVGGGDDGRPGTDPNLQPF